MKKLFWVKAAVVVFAVAVLLGYVKISQVNPIAGPTPIISSTPSATPIPAITIQPPTATPTPSATPTASTTPAPTSTPTPTPTPMPAPEETKSQNNFSLKIANWNLQVFGQTKAGNATLMSFYAGVIDDYDIVFVQEIRDSSNTAFPALCALLPGYSCLNSTRAGRTSSKEQYGAIYRSNISLAEWADFNPDSADRWERPPVKATFNASGYLINLYNIHVKPDDAKGEITRLQEVVLDEGNSILLGDLNADCSYYDASNRTEFTNWTWVVKDSDDTTSGSTDCAYDRIIVNNGANAEYANYGIYSNAIADGVSDHYLAWIKLNITQ